MRDLNWMSSGACLDYPNPDRFFPDTAVAAVDAKRVCAGCPVLVECSSYADELGVKDGVWGGRWRRPTAAKNARRRARRAELRAQAA